MDYVILKFKNNSNQILEKTERNDTFKLQGTNELYNIRHLLSKPRSFKIYEIKRLDNVAQNITQTFHVGKIVTLNNALSLRIIINEFHIQRLGNIIVLTNNNDKYGLQDILNIPVRPAAPAPTTANSNTTADITRQNDAVLLALQERIIAAYPRPIKVLGVLKSKRTESPKEFLIKFFKEPGWNNTKATVYVDDSSEQTSAGRRRSLGDLYMIMRYYYPNITLKELLKLLYVEIPAVITRGFRTSICSQINKRVWYYNSGSANDIINSGNNDEYGNNVQFYKSKLL